MLCCTIPSLTFTFFIAFQQHRYKYNAITSNKFTFPKFCILGIHSWAQSIGLSGKSIIFLFCIFPHCRRRAVSQLISLTPERKHFKYLILQRQLSGSDTPSYIPTGKHYIMNSVQFTLIQTNPTEKTKLWYCDSSNSQIKINLPLLS